MALVGREAEQERIDALLAAARAGRSGALALRGEPGIGRTALLEHARSLGAADMTVLATLGVEGESDVPFAGLLGLLGPVLGRLEELPERHRAALAGAFGIGPPAASDRLTVGAALLGLLDAAADERPVLALVDDAHWLDGASAGALLFAARRFGGERVSLLLALRDKEGLHLDLGGVDALHVPPLDRPAAASLLTRASGRELDDGVVDRLLKATTGNPLALLELPGRLTEGQLAGVESLEEPLATGAGVQGAFLSRARRLGDSAQSALVLAAASSSNRLEPVRRAAEALGIAPEGLEEAERDGLLELDGDALRFRHPLVRAAVYHGAPGPDRRRAHAALAEAEPSIVRQAWHLAAASTGSDERAAAALEAAAEEAVRRGDQGAAATALDRAAGLTPAEAETHVPRLLRAAGSD